MCQELNRLRKAALAFGFWELLKGVADLLERECTLLPDSAHPDAAFQLSHAAQQLKLASTGDSQYAAFDHNIAPMHTDFSSWASSERVKNWLKSSNISLCGPTMTQRLLLCWMLLKGLKGAASETVWTQDDNVHSFFDTAWKWLNVPCEGFVKC